MKLKKFSDPKDQQIHDALVLAFNALKEKGYNPQTQIKLYILTEDKSYITNYNNARQAMLELDREDIIKHLLNYYLEN